MRLDEILQAALDARASDVVLKAGAPPGFRLLKDLVPMPGARPLSSADIAAGVDTVLDEGHRERLSLQLQVDLAFELPGTGRFRANVFRQRGEIGMVIRVVHPEIRSVAELNLPPAVERLAEELRGLVLVTGSTGSGKSTTLAAIVDHINRNRAAHIITIEDPIEYSHRDRTSFVSQREIGSDAASFPSALTAALRQNPDVILVGEMRDRETIETALLAAETGHLVLSTLHTFDAPETIARIVGAFAEHEREQVRLSLAGVLKGVISQRLVPRADGRGMVPAVEVLVCSARVRDHLAEGKRLAELSEVIAQGGTTYGMQTFDQSLLSLHRQDLITAEEALRHSSNPGDLDLKLRGFSSGSDSSWQGLQARDSVGVGHGKT